ncbi:hypothetical protein [Streptomyces sp. 4R-3d]|uniref:hypothetical protein n=1 Tax=Streptomyces sp. 4R-3d TaxID=2559605 RepID=UPI001071BF37|nr:hypothetical protein [Streptomyces sp. 4R-3d]TFI28587.1 hypothetical protein E4P36_09780 [Streptomyces sp. 4R-3d]
MNAAQPVAEAAGHGGLTELTPGRYDWLRVELRRPADEETSGVAWLYFSDAVDPEPLVATPGSAVAWLPVPRRDVLHGVRLPERPELAAATLTPVPAHPATHTHRPDGADSAEGADTHG